MTNREMTLVAIVYIQFAQFTVQIPSETNHVCSQMIPYNARGKSTTNQTYKVSNGCFLKCFILLPKTLLETARAVPYKSW